jgi:Kef-type K+ transport system membrane component KefB
MSRSNAHKPPVADLRALRILPFYSVAVLAAIGAFWAICYFGRQLAPVTSAVAEPSATTASTQEHALFHVIVALIAVIVTGRLLALLLHRIQQPPVIGEVLDGILLGPSLLGWLAPSAANFILPASVAPYLGLIAQLAVILYMFLVGLEFDATMLHKKGYAATAISHISIVAPFLLGGLLALWLYPTMSPAGIRFEAFALFFGISLSVTAFPVLARILTDRGIQKHRLALLL